MHDRIKSTDLVLQAKPTCTCSLKNLPIGQPAQEMTAQEFIERLVQTLKSDCGESLYFSLSQCGDSFYVSSSCGGGCSKRQVNGSGASYFEAFCDLIEKCDRAERLEILKSQITKMDTATPLDAKRLSEREQALVQYGVEIGQSLKR